MKAIQVTRALHSRGIAFTIAILCLLAEAAYFFDGRCEIILGDHGTALPSANEWIPFPLANFIAAASVTVLVSLAMLLLSRWFNVLRSMTSLQIAFFAVIQLSVPYLSVQFYTGSVLVLAIPVCLMLLFSCYRAPSQTRHIFLIFLILSALSASQYCFAVYFIVFFLGCAQMRIMNGRTLTAALLGIITPWWILFGTGLITLSDFHLPQPSSVFTTFDLDNIILLISVGLSVLLVILSYILNVLKAIAYNAHSRAINGSLAFLSLVTIATICLDFRNFESYIPLLNFCASMQLAHYFSVHRAERSWIAIASVMTVYIIIFLCQTAI